MPVAASNTVVPTGSIFGMLRYRGRTNRRESGRNIAQAHEVPSVIGLYSCGDRILYTFVNVRVMSSRW